ncbi:DeoR/GlpR transcriptional regulator [Glaciibacter flavus]|uniref:Lactose phosphotransferase system repressor n=1 Tax=Orlajensenia flava TaxID=2565934 RepID=A0A4S4FK45_9MICO|nr:DeoR/GlpR family DNA-binding transcription regulator [Glaciibacter flavus]THG30324.1 DeoR/GlpR transcriptional regulator [Glaciibacter flavus]THG30587.1 DeoR/GlpR transcriptional regulator [Glaciibacter flavus]
MYATERQDRISTAIARVGRVSVMELSREFGVASETIRRDLDLLEEQGRLRRVHGGAVSAQSTTIAETSLADRSDQAREQKSAIARAALRQVPDTFRGSLLIDAGSTTAQFAELLAARQPAAPDARIDVSTNSLAIAATLNASAHLALRILGGKIRGITGAAVGPSTIAQLTDLRPDIAFIGANGVSDGFGLSTPDEAEAAVKAAMVHAARRVVVLADSSKLEVETLVRFARLDEVDTLITDAPPPALLASALAAHGVEVVLA